jgi:hypothetical protein
MVTTTFSLPRLVTGLILSGLFSSLLFTPSVAQAAEEGFVCAAVMRCNPDGTVMEEFDRGECAPMYRSQCLSRLANDVQESLVVCKEKLKSTQESLAGARRQLRDLRKKAAARR